MKCPNCNKNTLQEIEGNYTEGKYLIKNTHWLKCSNCGEEIFEPDMLEELEKAYYFNMNILTPDEIKNTRKLYKKTQNDLAKEINVQPITIKRWEGGDFIPPMDKCDLLRNIFEKWEKEKLKRLQLENWFTNIKKSSYPELCTFVTPEKCVVATHSSENIALDSEKINKLVSNLENNE